MVWGGTPLAAIVKAAKEATIVVSPELLEEYRQTPGVLHQERKINQEQLTGLIAAIGAYVAEAMNVQPSVRLALCRDPGDNLLLECCLEARADVLLTGDKDLLEVAPDLVAQHLPGLRIMNAKSYVAV